MTVILYTLIISFVAAFVLGFLLGFFKKIFYVPVDERVAKVRAVLPGANCGACGYPGCDGFAAAVVDGKAPVNACAAGGEATTNAVGDVLGIAALLEQRDGLFACQGNKGLALANGEYVGLKSCAAAKLSTNGTKLCPYGCIGFGDCVSVCTFNALYLGDDGLPHINYWNCTGCGVCATVCPQHLLSTAPTQRLGAVALCSNHSTNKASVLKQCKAGCIKCGKCEKSCHVKAITLVNGVPVVDYEKCTSCGDCVVGCPTHVLKLQQDIMTAKRRGIEVPA
ncbi:MAG: RnfABCDGE type electron transport complex subunit B [Treponema sp.]|jgi:Na+-translocating ferredoxin:NAD+ oxidoreductase RNF subunit RnfB|nr:RnfABCDGE type electron transport complex subunit B [Treponema sp.]